MGRKLAQVSLVVFLVLAFAAVASAAPNVGSMSKKGSLLVFPKIVYNTTNGVDTYIFIGNDQTYGTYVKCYWMDQNQSIEDFEFEITANQPIVFSASYNEYGPSFVDLSAGSLTCWATEVYAPPATPDETYMVPRKFDHLYGYAMIKTDNTAVPDTYVFYNATAFATPATAAQINALCTGRTYAGKEYCELPLNETYDTCPKYLVGNFVTGADDDGDLTGPILGDVRADLGLWPCKQDLRQDRKPTCTKAKFDVWNGWEVKFTGAYQCFKCFFEGYLERIGTVAAGYDLKGKTKRYGWGPAFGYDKFLGTKLRTTTARVRIQGIASSICDNGQTNGCTWVDPAAASPTSAAVKSVNSPLLGVLMYSNLAAFKPVAGYGLQGAGYDLSGFIYYDKDYGTLAPKK